MKAVTLSRAELGKLLKPRSKYNARWTNCGSHLHASKKEAIRCSELQALEKGKLINDLQQQVPFKLIVHQQLVGKYVADFTYYLPHGPRIVEDCKGMRTALYILKRKLMKACLGITIKET